MSNHIYNARYKAEAAKYKKKDGIIALCFFAYLFIVSFIYGMYSIPIATFHGVAIYALVNIAPLIIIVHAKKEGLSSIGIHKKHFLAALCLGLVFSVVALMIYRGLLPGFIQGGQLESIGIILTGLYMGIILATWEDIAFAGYIQTRLYGLIKHDILAVLVGALLFALIHISMRWAVFGLSAFGALVSLETPGWIGMHVIHNLVFRKYFSIFPVIMLHTFINVAQGRLWASEVSGLDDTISFVIIVLAVVVWAVYQVRKGKKASMPE